MQCQIRIEKPSLGRSVATVPPLFASKAQGKSIERRSRTIDELDG
jgi:hypothetical protein